MIADILLATTSGHAAGPAGPAVNYPVPVMEGLQEAPDFEEILHPIQSTSLVKTSGAAITLGPKIEVVSSLVPALTETGGKDLPIVGKVLPASIASRHPVIEADPELETTIEKRETGSESPGREASAPAEQGTLKPFEQGGRAAPTIGPAAEIVRDNATKLSTAPATPIRVPSSIKGENTNAEKVDHDMPSVSQEYDDTRLRVPHRNPVQAHRQETLPAATLLGRDQSADAHVPDEKLLEQPQSPAAASSDSRWQLAPRAPSGGFETLVRDGRQIEVLIENLASTREFGRQARGEMQIRHDDFGLLTMRLASSESEIKASLVSRDPAFIAAAQQALSERIVQQAPDSSAAQSRHQDPASGQSGQSGQSGTSSHSDGRSAQTLASERDEPAQDLHEDTGELAVPALRDVEHGTAGYVPACGLFA